jgi:formylglycine-generating enzyme required for sulfatase activity
VDFREQIKQMIERSNVVIAIIGPHWLGEQPDAPRRIDNPADFVRLEIAYALERGIPVIPVLVNNAPMPSPDRLPQEIEGLAYRNALVLDTGIDFHHHADRLITGIGKAMDIAPRSRGPQKVPEPTAPAITKRPIRKIAIWSASIVLGLTASALLVWYVGTHRREPAKQVATANESNSDKSAQPFSESAPTAKPAVSTAPSVEQSVSPLPLGSQAPKEAALTTALSPTAVEVRKAERVEGEEKAASSPASTAVQTQRDSRPIYVVTASVSKTVNIRSDHSARSTTIEKLKPGDRVFLEDGRVRNDDPPHSTTWQKVTTMNGATGWIDLVYLAPEQSSPPRLASEQPKSIIEQSSQPQITSPALDFASITKEHPYVDSLGMKFVPVLITGGPTSDQPVLFSIWDTRVKDFAAFIEQSGYDMKKGEAAYTLESDGKGGWSWKQAGGDWRDPHFPAEAKQSNDHPVVCVSWDDAMAFCKWLTEREQQAGRLPAEWSYRLPSDHEWSCAVGIGERESASKSPEAKDGKIKNVYPWGEQWPPPSAAGNYGGEESRIGVAKKDWNVITGYRDGWPRTSPVGSFEPNQYGLYDMGGNVWQWCADKYKASKSWRVLRGASWLNLGPDLLLSSARRYCAPTGRYDVYGFRVVVTGSASAPGTPMLGTSPETPTTSVQTPAAQLSGTTNQNVIATPAAPQANNVPMGSKEHLIPVLVKKYGASVLLPPDIFPDAEKLNNEDTISLKGVSWSGRTTLSFSKAHSSLNKVYTDCATGHKIDYKVLRQDWFVVSGDLGPVDGIDMGFYIKGLKQGDDVVMMNLQYEDDDFPFYDDETFNAVVHSFKLK